MIYTFIMLLIVVAVLLFYFNERNRFLLKVEDLTANLQKEIEERLNLESKYSKILTDLKKEEEFTKSKKIDETQLMFTKVNMLDDKLTYFNTTFKTKLENITKLLNSCLNNDSPEVDNKVENLANVTENSSEVVEDISSKPVTDTTNETKIISEKTVENLEEQNIMPNQNLDDEQKNSESFEWHKAEENIADNNAVAVDNIIEEPKSEEIEHNEVESINVENQEGTRNEKSEYNEMMGGIADINLPDKEAEKSLFENEIKSNYSGKISDSEFLNLNESNNVTENNNESQKTESDTSIDEGFDIKESIEKLKAQLEEGNK